MTSATPGGTALYRFEPDYTVPPGELIADFLEEEGMTQVELARRLGITTKHLNQFIAGSATLSNELAILLERVTRISSRLLNSMEADYQDFNAREREAVDLADQVGWLDELPLKDLIKRGHIADMKKDRVGQLREVLRFFGVAQRSSFDEVCASAAYRKSKAYESDPNAVATWLRIGELEASAIECAAFDKAKFRSVLDDARALTKLVDPEQWVPELTRLCAAAGVAVVFVQEIGKTRLSGATMWLTPEKAMIVLSLRGSWAEGFWFTFFHEAAHVLLHSKKRAFIDNGSTDGELEEEADEFALDHLIPRRYVPQLAELKSAAAVRMFADRIGVGSGIVAGRLHRENLIPANWFAGADIHPRYKFH